MRALVRVGLLSSLLLFAAPARAEDPGYVDCGSNCSNLAAGKTVAASGAWNPATNPVTRVNDGDTGTNPLCEGTTGYCAIASTATGAQGIGNFLQIDLGAVMSVKSVTVYGRRDFALNQAQNLNLKLSTDGTTWTTTYMADTTSPSGLTVSTQRVARYVRVETTTVVYLSLYEIVVTGTTETGYEDCGSNCTNLALGMPITASGLWSANNPATKADDGNTGTTSACEGAAGYCAIASTPSGAQGIGNYLQIDLGALRSVQSVTVFGRRDTAFTQGQNLNLKLSTDGTNWTTWFLADTTSSSGLTVSTFRQARWVRVETTTVSYLSLYEIVVTGLGPGGGPGTYVDCGTTCSDLALGKSMSASGLWSSNNPATKANDGNTGTTSACEGASGYCAIASTATGGQGVGNYLQVDLGVPMSVKSVTVYGRRDAAPTQAQNLNLKLSSDGIAWTTYFMADTTSASGLTVPTARLARYVRVETTTVVYLSLYEIVVTGTPLTTPPPPRSIVASPSSGLVTDKMGKIAQSSISLSAYGVAPPWANVSITVTPSDYHQAYVRGPYDDFFKRGITIVLTPADFADPHTLEILGVDDGQQNGDVPYTVSLTTSSSDPAWSGLTASISATNIDRVDYNFCASLIQDAFWQLDEAKMDFEVRAPDFTWPEYASGFPTSYHFEGVARLRRDSYLALSGTGVGASHLFYARVPEREGSHGCWAPFGTPSPGNGIFNYPASHVVSTAYPHAGGISTLGDFIGVPLEGPSSVWPRTKVVFYDVHDPEHPVLANTEINRPEYSHAGAVGMVKLPDSRYLAAVQSDCPAEVQFYLSDGRRLDEGTTFTKTYAWSAYNSGDFPPCNDNFPGPPATIQNVDLILECESSWVYMIVTWNDRHVPEGINWVRLYIVQPVDGYNWSGPLIVARIGTNGMPDGPYHFLAAGGSFVSRDHQLVVYGSDPDTYFDLSAGHVATFSQFCGPQPAPLEAGTETVLPEAMPVEEPVSLPEE